MNHYDYAHNLARALKESEEYQAMLKAKEQMEADPKNKEMLLEFRKFQWEMQKSQALQEEIDEVTKYNSITRSRTSQTYQHPQSGGFSRTIWP